jgi:3',5'-cyclic AMP phosphodiesterase CpdA
MSDLHCRLTGTATDSILEVGATRIPPLNHPVQALLSHIAERTVRADALIVPGDFANRASREGLSQGWDFAIEVARNLGTDNIIPALGNHDVDSKRSRPDRDAFYDARNLRPGFPFKNENACRMYFSDGFCLETIGEHTQMVAVNTVIDHHDEQSAERGRFDDSRIYRLKEFLNNTPLAPIRIAVMHHHPILHAGPFNKDADVLQNGDNLVTALRETGCRLIIHGHRHLARMSTSNGLAVFASGSFSANLGIYASAMANTFHFAEIEHIGGHTRGRIETWVFHLGSGWVRASSVHSGISFLTGFGAREHVDKMAESLIALAKKQPSPVDRFTWSQLLEAAADFVYLSPPERSILEARLLAHGLQLADTTDGSVELWRLSGS